MVRTSKTMLNKSGKSERPCLVADLRGTAFSFSILRIMLAVAFSYMTFIMLKSVVSVQFSCSVVSDSLRPYGLQHARLPCPSPTPGVCSISLQTHVRWVHNAIQASHPLLPSSPSALNLSQNQSLFQWISSSHQEAKVLELQLQHQSIQWIFRTDFL